MTSIVSDESENLKEKYEKGELTKGEYESKKGELNDKEHILQKEKMKIGKAIGGSILLAIGLLFVVGGGASVITSLCLGQPYGSCRSDFMMLIVGSIMFWIGIVPTIFGVRFVAKA